MRWSMRSRRLVNGDVNCDDSDPLYGRLDINAATAEELMTLPGINRSAATNVVLYRAQIGGFRKVEDMALVPGVGATRFGHLRAEICVGESASSTVSTTLRRSGSSATSSGIDVSLTPVDSVSRDFVAAVSGLQSTSTASDNDNDTETRLRPDTAVNSRTDRPVVRVDRDRVATLTTSSRRSRCPPTCPVRGSTDDREVVRVATWNLWPCSSERLEDVGVRQLVTTTVLESR